MASKITPSALTGLATSLTEYAARTTAALVAYSEVPLPAPSPDENELPSAWSGVIGVENELTGDGRLIETDALEWTTPIPLRFVLEDTGGHQGAVTVGRILSISRGDGGQINASGDFDLGSDVGREAARLVGAEMLNGVSMDLDSVAFEVRVAKEVIEEQDELWEAMMEDDYEPPERETAEDGSVIVWKGRPDDEVMVTTSARVRAATLVSIPAFATAQIFASAPEPVEAEALVASAAPVEPPKAWFARPEASRPTALTITDEGQVYGHLATWDTCHVADPSGAGVCVMAPKNKTGYAYFHTGAVKTAEGDLVTTGTIRFNTGHAKLSARADSAAAHYDNTGLAGADIHVIDGTHGIWVAGALRPGVTPEQVRTLRASPLSGDWRYVNGRLELVGALAVNLPGFPIPRTQGLVASGQMMGLVAAGMIAPPSALATKQFSDRDAAYIQKLIDRERLHEQRQLADRARAAQNRVKVSRFAAQRRSMAARTKVGA